jgi:hypothetical protein
MKTNVFATLVAIFVISTLANTTTQCCGPNLFLDRANFYRSNPAQLGQFIITNIFSKMDCSTSKIPNGAEGNNVSLTVSEGCARVAQTIKWLRDCPNPVKLDTITKLPISALPSPIIDSTLNSLIKPGAANLLQNIESYINLQSCTLASQVHDAHKAAVGTTIVNGVETANKGCKVDMKYNLGIVKSSYEHSKY